MFWGILLSTFGEKFCSLYMLRFELRTQNDNTVSQMDSHWPKLIHFLIRRNVLGLIMLISSLKNQQGQSMISSVRKHQLVLACLESPLLMNTVISLMSYFLWF